MLKSVAAAVYTNYETSIIDDAGIEQEDHFSAGPIGKKLVLKTSFLKRDETDKGS